MQNPEYCAFFGRKMVRNAVHNEFLNTLTTGTAFLRVPLELTPDRSYSPLREELILFDL